MLTNTSHYRGTTTATASVMRARESQRGIPIATTSAMQPQKAQERGTPTATTSAIVVRAKHAPSAVKHGIWIAMVCAMRVRPAPSPAIHGIWIATFDAIPARPAPVAAVHGAPAIVKSGMTIVTAIAIGTRTAAQPVLARPVIWTATAPQVIPTASAGAAARSAIRIAAAATGNPTVLPATRRSARPVIRTATAPRMIRTASAAVAARSAIPIVIALTGTPIALPMPSWKTAQTGLQTSVALTKTSTTTCPSV